MDIGGLGLLCHVSCGICNFCSKQFYMPALGRLELIVDTTRSFDSATQRPTNQPTLLFVVSFYLSATLCLSLSFFLHYKSLSFPFILIVLLYVHKCEIVLTRLLFRSS